MAQFDGIALIRITFPAFTDGRGFSLAQHLRRLGYTGRIRAAGQILPDQYAMIRRVGFDEVELAPEQAERHREDDWIARSDWKENDPRARLRQIAR